MSDNTAAQSIFKAYDIRGVYPTEIHEEIAYRIGGAYSRFMKQETGNPNPRLVICRDMRTSSQPLKAAVERGMVDEGVLVVDIGLASTPTFYFGVAYFGFDGGIQITASHNPPQFNGCKMVRRSAIPIGAGTGMEEIARLVETYVAPNDVVKGRVEEKTDVLSMQVATALTHIQKDRIRPFHIVIDAANGMGAPFMDALFSALPCTVEKMFFDLDGTFPNHEADPLKDENNRLLQERVVQSGADMGIAFDGDADRVFFIDHTGKTVPQAIMRGVFAQLFLKDHPGATICYDIRPGRVTEDMIREAGGVPVVTRVGHSLIKAKAREVGAVFGGESSGHFFVNMPYGFFEAPDICILKLLQELSEKNVSLADYTAPYYRYAHSGEINFVVNDSDAVFQRLRKQYGDHLTYDFDGLTFAWDDWWFNVRSSQTERKFRLNLEAIDSALMAQKVQEVRAYIY